MLPHLLFSSSPSLPLSLLLVTVLCLAFTAGCGPAPDAVRATAQPVDGQPAKALTPRAFVPSFSSNSDRPAQKRVLFIQGDHVPESDYPHSRVGDDGSKPESFTRLSAEVLQNDLQLGVDEYVLTAGNTITAGQLANYAVIVLGSNARALTTDEAGVLSTYYQKGGSLLAYADFQYGPNNWDSDNSFLGQFGIEVFTDNFQPAVDISAVESSHPVMAGVKTIRGEGISQFRISNGTLAENEVLAKCEPLARSGCILPDADQAKVQAGDVVACVFVRESAGGGRLAGVCDRNLFQNGPGPGSDLDQVDDRLFARNLFRWLSKQ
ncbi:MAG: hypothetical protein M1546_21990 [Chloroflexi bacterium]|nr:hypothetical protein [Chloroflexota bacterium]